MVITVSATRLLNSSRLHKSSRAYSSRGSPDVEHELSWIVELGQALDQNTVAFAQQLLLRELCDVAEAVLLRIERLRNRLNHVRSGEVDLVPTLRVLVDQALQDRDDALVQVGQVGVQDEFMRHLPQLLHPLSKRNTDALTEGTQIAVVGKLDVADAQQVGWQSWISDQRQRGPLPAERRGTHAVFENDVVAGREIGIPSPNRAIVRGGDEQRTVAAPKYRLQRLYERPATWKG
jgi:hypothetical protein